MFELKIEATFRGQEGKVEVTESASPLEKGDVEAWDWVRAQDPLWGRKTRSSGGGPGCIAWSNGYSLARRPWDLRGDGPCTAKLPV